MRCGNERERTILQYRKNKLALVIGHEFRHNIVEVVCEPLGYRLLDPKGH